MSVQSLPATRSSIRRQVACRELCRIHGRALIAIAQLVLDDAQDVCDVVADAVAAECRTSRAVDVGATETRRRLARSVFDRSRGRLVMRERFGQPAGVPAARGSRELPSVLAGLSPEVRAAVALTMFGLHGLTEAAAVLSVPPETVLGRLRVALAAANAADGGMPTQRRPGTQRGGPAAAGPHLIGDGATR